LRFSYFIFLMTVGLTVSSLTLGSTLKLPDIGDSARANLPLDIEQRYGDSIMRQLRRQTPLLYDPLLEQYIDNLAFHLVSNNQNTGQRKFDFFIVNNPQINAFALPGGYIGIHSGLIGMAQNESELASVISHEIAHVTQLHIARRIEQASELNLPSIAAMLASIAIATQNPEAGLAALQASQAGLTQVMLNHSRAHEHEADRVGIQTLARAGYDSYAAATFFEKLINDQKFVNKPPPFLSTHPVSQLRVADARARAANYPQGQPTLNQDFHLMRARVLLLSMNKHEALNFFRNLHQQHPDDTSRLYGYALALLKNEQYAQADKVISRLTNDYKDNLTFKLLAIESLQAQRQHKEAIKRLENLLSLYPANHSIIMLLARNAIDAGQPDKAATLLRKHVHRHPENLQVYSYFSEALGKAGYEAEMHEALAEQKALVGDYEGAIEQLTIGLKKNNQFYTRERMSARIQQLRQQQQLEKSL